jgi:hypothetical protein
LYGSYGSVTIIRRLKMFSKIKVGEFVFIKDYITNDLFKTIIIEKDDMFFYTKRYGELIKFDIKQGNEYSIIPIINNVIVFNLIAYLTKEESEVVINGRNSKTENGSI